eukprot:scaffold922_cov33-Phaeocystis_antarctica.AAC.1
MVLRLLLHVWSGCGGLLNGVAVADTKPCRRGDAPYPALSRSTQAHATPCCLEALLLRQLDPARAAILPCAGLWAAACGPGGVWPCGGVWSCAMRVEGRRRPKKRW